MEIFYQNERRSTKQKDGTQDAHYKVVPLRQGYINFNSPLGNFMMHLC